MASCEGWLEIAFGVALILILFMSLLLIGCFIKPRTKPQTAKKTKEFELMIAILIGYLGGILGNAFVISLFEVGRQYQPPWFFPAIFVITSVFSVVFIIRVFQFIQQ
jgi:formate/nitrite transporter FocA (FNT family)